MTPMKILIATLLLSLLAACGREQAPEAQRPARDSVEQPGTPPGAAARDANALPPGEPAAPAPAWTPIDSLPPTRDLVVTVEGQPESREARLFTSPQAYAIHVLPQLEMTPEEPCCDLAWARVDDGLFMRIERIDPAADLATLRGNMELALSSVGPAFEHPATDFAEPGVEVEVELAMRSEGDDVSMEMLVARIDGGRYRVTLHLPHGEALEGIVPSLWAMLGSLRTTGPRPEA